MIDIGRTELDGDMAERDEHAAEMDEERSVPAENVEKASQAVAGSAAAVDDLSSLQVDCFQRQAWAFWRNKKKDYHQLPRGMHCRKQLHYG